MTASRSIEAAGVTLHALERNPAGAPAILLLHGWLDHAHGFDGLAAALPSSWRSVALDFRGHGRSGHVAGGLYQFTDYLADVEATLDALQLSRVHLVGHSLGGSVALIYAAAQPSRVASVTSIDSIGPSGGDAGAVVDRLRRFLRDLHKPPRKRTWPTVADAAARLQANVPGLSEQAAEHLAQYGTRPVDGGVEFTFDPAHRRTFGLTMDEAQVLSAFRAVEAPVQILRGTNGLPFDEARGATRLQALRAPPPVVIEGSHHLHLDQPRAVAEAIAAFVRRVQPGA